MRKVLNLLFIITHILIKFLKSIVTVRAKFLSEKKKKQKMEQISVWEYHYSRPLRVQRSKVDFTFDL